MGIGQSVDVFVNAPGTTEKKTVSGCFIGCCAGGRVKEHYSVPLKPPGEKKKQVIPSPYMFMHIDEHVRKTPVQATRTIKTLASYLTIPARNDLERARAFYYWICNNISYDSNYMYSKNESYLDPMTVLRHCVASSSEAYTNVFAALCRAAEIPVKKLKGFAKDPKFDPEHPYTYMDEPEHSWNAVFVLNDWRFVDCTWGSGFIDDEGQWHKYYEEFWFMTDPDNFINDHFPHLKNDPKSSEMWQLLDRPVTLEVYNKTVRTEPVTKDWGIEFSHREPIIVFRKELHIVVNTTIVPLVEITATLDTADKVNMDSYVGVLRDREDHYKILVRPPSPGVYILRLFGKREGDVTSGKPGLVKYILKCTDINNMVKNFPISYTAAQTFQCCLLEPTFRDLEANMPVKFRVASPYLIDVYVEDVALEKVDNYTWEGEILTPKRSGNFLTLFGSSSKKAEHRKRQELYKFNII